MSLMGKLFIKLGITICHIAYKVQFNWQCQYYKTQHFHQNLNIQNPTIVCMSFNSAYHFIYQTKEKYSSTVSWGTSYILWSHVVQCKSMPNYLLYICHILFTNERQKEGKRDIVFRAKTLLMSS